MPQTDTDPPREDTPLVNNGGGDVEEGLLPDFIGPVKDGNTKVNTTVGVELDGVRNHRSLQLYC